MQTFCHIRGWYARLSDEGVQSPLTAKGSVNVQIILVQVQGRRAVQNPPSCLRVMCKTPFHVWGWCAKNPFMSEGDVQNPLSCLSVISKTTTFMSEGGVQTPLHVSGWRAKPPFNSEGDVQKPPFMSERDVQKNNLSCLRVMCKPPFRVSGRRAKPPFMSEGDVQTPLSCLRVLCMPSFMSEGDVQTPL